MKFTVDYSFRGRDGKTEGGEEVPLELDEKSIKVFPRSGAALRFTIREISGIAVEGYRIKVALGSGELLEIFNAGHQFEDIVRVMKKFRTTSSIKDSLMNEAVKKANLHADFSYAGADGKESAKGECEFRIYETGIVVIPEGGEPMRIDYSTISTIEEKGHDITITRESGEKLTLFRLGEQFGLVGNTISGALNALSAALQEMLGEMLPSADPAIIRQASKLMKDGKAVPKAELDKVSPEFWLNLEKKISKMGIKQEYEFLKGIGQKDRMCVGIKRGLMGGFTGEYLWLLVPVYGTDPKKPGNAVIMESITTAEEAAARGAGAAAAAAPGTSGKATYFFRICGRGEYAEKRSMKELDGMCGGFIKKLNACMIATNFRREPIYLTEKKLEDGKYEHYREAIARSQDLQMLRRHFIGKVAHNAPDTWKESVMAVLEFNVSVEDDLLKWSRKGAVIGEEAGEEEQVASERDMAVESSENDEDMVQKDM
ncbi:MAG: hypothetical protein PHQ80_02830 [Candidatus ainarchaeum sp.]|nr:hypothetical protein [Candidatus ainarchaeum sp.]